MPDGARESTAPGAPPHPVVATVMRVDFGGIVLLADDGAHVDATVPGRLRGRRKALGNAVVVGDRVHLGWEHERAVVKEVEPRRNAFSRRAAGERAEEQVVAVNLDQVVVVASVVQPEFKAGLVDRVLAQADASGVAARLVLNKTDLGSPAEVAALTDDYTRAGVAVHAVSAKSRHGVEEVRAACMGLRSLFVGHSGVGKSTLLTAMAPGHELLAGDVNAVTGKGRHTTTAALLLRPEPGWELIDTPGVRAFALWGISPEDLAQHYPELRPHVGHCRFGDCRHDREPGCALHAARDRGDIAPRRFDSFRKLRDELVQEIRRW